MFLYFLLGIDCFKPANGETVSIATQHNIPVDISLSLLKRETTAAGMGLKTIQLFLKLNALIFSRSFIIAVYRVLRSL